MKSLVVEMNVIKGCSPDHGIKKLSHGHPVRMSFFAVYLESLIVWRETFIKPLKGFWLTFRICIQYLLISALHTWAG